MKTLNIFVIPIISILCYYAIELLKRMFNKSQALKQFYPLLSALSGTFLGIFTYWAAPDLIVADSALGSALVGLASGLGATGGYEIRKKATKTKSEEPIDTSPPKYFITGDKHGHYSRLIEFCQANHLRKKDVIVILGDSGFNYYGDERDDKLKSRLAKENVTLFCLHGNKENRPQNIPTYGIRTFCGGIVYYEPQYPNLFFAQDGEVYNFNGKEFLIVGGAHSVDKIRCLDEGLPFWEDEMPSEEVKQLVENELAIRNHQIHGFLTHTCPLSCLPTEMFISTKRASDEERRKAKKKKSKKPDYPLDIDRSTEEWLEELMQKNDFQIWYCGHYHVDKELGKVHMMQKEILPFCNPTEDSL